MAKHKCKIPDPPPDTGRWMGTYGDMVTLLMAFFVMLFAVSETNNQKFVAFVSGLAGPFDNTSIELGLVDGGAALLASGSSPISLIAPPPEGNPDAPAPQEVIDEIERQTASQDQLDGVAEQIQGILDGSTVPINADLRDDERGLVISISADDVLFPVGSAELADIGVHLISQIAPILQNAPNTIVIEGHTDNTPLNTDGYSNWNLSTDRAVAVLELLGDVYGVSYERVSAAGYGEHRPLVPNDSSSNRSINRRVEILVVGLDISEGGAPAPPAANGAPAEVVDNGTDGAEDVAAGQPGSTPADGAGDAPTANGPPATSANDDVAIPGGEDIRPFPDGTQVGQGGVSTQTPLATILGP